jgi:hypothetical protein
MALPLVRYLQLTAARRWVRLCLLLSIPCFVVAVLGTYSRGAVVGLAVTMAGLAIKSRHRMRLALVAGIALAGAVQFMPEHWHARIASIADYGDDSSAQARFQSWGYALEVARDSPIVGGGFEIFRGNQAPTSVGYRGAHSIYFETLAEHGYPGLVIFLALGIGTYLSAGSIIRRARDHPDLAWGADLGAMVQAAVEGRELKQVILRCEIEDAGGRIVAHGVGARSLAQDKGDLNKALKMAEKSGHIDASLRLAGLSEVFTQDIEDMLLRPAGAADAAQTTGQVDRQPPGSQQEPPPDPALLPIAEMQRKRLEARIRGLRLDRERVKAWMRKKWDVDEFKALTQGQFRELDAKLEEFRKIQNQELITDGDRIALADFCDEHGIDPVVLAQAFGKTALGELTQSEAQRVWQLAHKRAGEKAQQNYRALTPEERRKRQEAAERSYFEREAQAGRRVTSGT